MFAISLFNNILDKIICCIQDILQNLHRCTCVKYLHIGIRRSGKRIATPRFPDFTRGHSLYYFLQALSINFSEFYRWFFIKGSMQKMKNALKLTLQGSNFFLDA